MRVEEIAKRLRALSGRYGVYDIFRDWVASMACAMSNAVDRRPEVHAQREAEYMAIVQRHGDDGPRVMAAFKELFHEGLVPALEGEADDVLGKVYTTMELANRDAGQFFTPMPVCDLMAELSLHDTTMPPCGFIKMHEPAIGGGAMVIAHVRAMQRRGLDPSRQLYVVGVDIDRKVLQMAYVQLSLLGVPAVLYVGDTLRMEMREDWFTPVYVVDGWRMRLGLAEAFDRARMALADTIDSASAKVVEALGEPGEADEVVVLLDEPEAAQPPASEPDGGAAPPQTGQLPLF